MGYSHLIALTGFVEGREEDYNDWYRWVHLRDVMRLGFGVIAAQRFRRTDAAARAGRSGFDQPYLCIYEVTDPPAMTRAHAPVFTDEMPVSDAYSLDNASEVYFDEIAGFTHIPGRRGEGDVFIERIEQAACAPEVTDWYRRERFDALARLPGVIAGSLGQPSGHQMFEQPLSGLCAILRTRDAAATAAAWPSIGHGDAPAASAVSLDSYAPVMDRLTMIDVREPGEQDRAMAAAARRRLGGAVLAGPPPDIRTAMFD